MMPGSIRRPLLACTLLLLPCLVLATLPLGPTGLPKDPDAVNKECSQNRCVACAMQENCGWCASSFTCMYGDENGPLPLRNDSGVVPCAAKWTYSTDKSFDYVNNTMCTYPKGTSVQRKEWPKIPHDYDVICENGGQRYWDSDLAYGSSYCVCPDGWTGQRCHICTRDSVCGIPGVTTPNATCSKNLIPYAGRDLFDHTLSCSCRGKIATEVCNIGLTPPGLPNGVRTYLKYNHNNKSAVVTSTSAVPMWLPWHLMSGIAYYGYLKDCAIAKAVTCPPGAIYDWKDGQPCAHIQCAVDGHMFAPNPHNQYCAHWAPTYQSSWRWRGCFPEDLLHEVSTVEMYCQYASEQEGSFFCAFNVPKLVGPVPMLCETGTCITTDLPPPPTPPLPPQPFLTTTDWFIIILSVPVGLVLSIAVCLSCVLWGRKKELWDLDKLDARGMNYADTHAQPRGRRRLRSTESPLLLSVDDHTEESKLDAAAKPNYGAPGSPVVERLPAYLRQHTHGPMPPLSGEPGTAEPETVFSFSDVKFAVRVRSGCSTSYRPVLRGVQASIRPSLFAILGPSGAGKTTLLDILAGRKSTSGGAWSGRICINGVEFSPKQLRSAVGYIMQDDVIMGTMTVREYLLFQTRMRCSPHLTLQERYQRVNDVLQDLGLTRVASSKIGDSFTRGISGGEKRRVSIAAELITDPQILVVDEPTSGLDSANAKSVVDALARVAESGRVVVMSIHQPRSYIWSRFHGLLLLGKRGEIVYCGERAACLDHFAEQGFPAPADYNPADFLLDMVAGLTDAEALRLSMNCPQMADGRLGMTTSAARPVVVEGGGASAGAGAAAGSSGDGDGDGDEADGFGGDKTGLKPQRRPMASGLSVTPAATLARYQRHGARFHTRLWELSLRTFMNVLRNPFLFFLNYTATIFVGVLTGFVFHHLPFNFEGLQDRLGLMFFCFLFFGMTSLSSLGIWREERLIFLRERAAGVYNTTAYFIAKVFCDIFPLRVLPPIIFAAACYWNVELNNTPVHFLVFTATITLVNILAAALCLAVGALVPNLSLANLIASLLLLYTLLLCGLLSHNQSTFGLMRVFQHISFLNYAFEILANNEFIGQNYNLSPVLPGHAQLPAFPASGTTVVLTLGLELNKLEFDLLMMCGFLVVFLLALYIILKFFVKERR